MSTVGARGGPFATHRQYPKVTGVEPFSFVEKMKVIMINFDRMINNIALTNCANHFSSKIVGNKAKSVRIQGAYQGVKNVRFSENLA